MTASRMRVIGVDRRQARNGSVAVTGSGSGIEGLRNIVTGQQSMTVFEDPRAEADAVARLVGHWSQEGVRRRPD